MIEECWPDLGGRRRGCSTRLERDREGWRREKRREQRAESREQRRREVTTGRGERAVNKR
jgi:hypothetical protein